MRVGDLGACEGEEEEEGRAEEFIEDGDEGIVEPFWHGAVEGWEALAERLGVLLRRGRVSEGVVLRWSVKLDLRVWSFRKIC